MKDILPNHNPEYWKHTKKCPACFGRGRVAIEPYELTNDTYQEVYEQEETIKEVYRILKNET
jgi:hypothetical protein